MNNSRDNDQSSHVAAYHRATCRRCKQPKPNDTYGLLCEDCAAVGYNHSDPCYAAEKTRAERTSHIYIMRRKGFIYDS